MILCPLGVCEGSYSPCLRGVFGIHGWHWSFLFEHTVRSMEYSVGVVEFWWLSFCLSRIGLVHPTI